MKRVLQIAAGIVLGFLSWNFLLAWLEHQNQQAERQRLDQAYKAAAAECKQGKQEACSEAVNLHLTKIQQLAEDTERLSR